MTNIHNWTTSVANYIEHCIDTGEDNKVDKISLTINIDGVQIFKSPNTMAYSMLVDVMEYPDKIFNAGTYVPNKSDHPFEFGDVVCEFIKH